MPSQSGSGILWKESNTRFLLKIDLPHRAHAIKMQIKPRNEFQSKEICNSISISVCILIGFLSSAIFGLMYRYDYTFDPLGMKKAASKTDLRRRNDAAKIKLKRLETATGLAFSEIQARYLKECLAERSSHNQKRSSGECRANG